MPPRELEDGIDIADLTDYINRELSLHEIYISDSDTREALRELRDVAEGHGYFRQELLIRRLRTKLNKDQESGGEQGLYRSRTRFIISCYTAKRLRARDLAEAVLRFFSTESHVIVHDKLPLLTEWCVGLRQLQGLVNEGELNRAFHDVARRGPPLFEEWRRPGADMYHDDDIFDRDRGRHQLQLLVPRPRHVRHASMPAYWRRNYLEDPPYPRTAYHLPLVVPRHDLDAIRMHQRFQDLQLAGLRYGMEDLQRQLF